VNVASSTTTGAGVRYLGATGGLLGEGGVVQRASRTLFRNINTNAYTNAMQVDIKNTKLHDNDNDDDVLRVPKNDRIQVIIIHSFSLRSFLL